MASTFQSTFKNQYGETWIFEYDFNTGTGVVRGSDVDWEEYPVVEGRADDLVMHQEERDWLKSAWQEALRAGPESET